MIVLLLGVLFVPALPAAAQTPYFAAGTSSGEVCDTIGSVSPGGTSCGPTTQSNVNRLIRLAINMLSILAGVIAVILVIVSGLKYIMSQGDAAQISSAKRSLIYAIVGIIVVALSQVIVRFVVKK